MKSERRSTVAEAAGDEWRCRKHPPHAGPGVCPYCLRDRLRELCPECARERPCACSCASPSSSSSASPLPGGAVGRVSSLIEREHRAAAAAAAAAQPQIGRSRSVAAAVAGDRLRGWKARVWGWPPFGKPARRREASEGEELGLARCSSVSATTASLPKWRGWGWYFPSPMKAFRHRKSSAAAAEAVAARSPVQRG